MALLFLCYPIMLGLNIVLLSHGEIDPIDKTLRSSTYLAPLVALTTLLGLANQRLAWRHAFFVFPLAAIASGIVAITQRYYFSIERAHGFTNPILFADISVILVALTLATQPLLPVNLQRYKQITIFATLMGLSAIILSGSRGSWVAIPILGWLLIHGYLAQRRRLYWSSIGLLALAIPLSYQLPTVSRRVNEAISDISRFFVEGHFNSSVGARLEVWRISLFELFPANPWFGIGIHQFKPVLKQMASTGQISPSFGWISHPHNEWLYVLVEQGLVGLLALITLYLGCFFIIEKQIKSISNPQPFRLANRSLFIGLVIFGMTDIITGNLITATFFFGLMAWLMLAACDASQKDATS
jgi:O-antigen ligase